MIGSKLTKKLTSSTDLTKFINPSTGKPNSASDSCVFGDTLLD